MSVDVRRVEERAPQVDGASHGALRLGVIGRPVRVAECISADRPAAKPDLADLETGAPEGAGLHASSSVSRAGVSTVREQVVPTHTVAACAVAIRRTTTLRGRYVWSATRCMAHAGPSPAGPETSILVTGFTAQSAARSSVAPCSESSPAAPAKAPS